jgi:hypothetical protein
MEQHLTIEHVDPSGSILEVAQRIDQETRRSFLDRGAALAASAIAGQAAVAAQAATARAATRVEIGILQFDLLLEYLQASLYTEAERLGVLGSTTLAWARVVGAHERAHVRAIRALLRPRDRLPSPSFDFRGVTEDESAFTRTAVAFEDLTAALLKSQMLRISSRPLLAALLSLHSVEARHAAWIRDVVGVTPASAAFDRAVSEDRVRALVRQTRFVVSAPRTRRRGQPRFTG